MLDFLFRMHDFNQQTRSLTGGEVTVQIQE